MNFKRNICQVKDAIPNDAQDFSFNLNNNSTIDFGTFYMDDDSDPAIPNTLTFDVPPGTWYAKELMPLPAGWSLTNLVCTDPTSNTTVDLATGTATIWINPTGETDPNFATATDIATNCPACTPVPATNMNNAINVVGYCLRQGSQTPGGSSTNLIDNLKIGTRFADVAGNNTSPLISGKASVASGERGRTLESADYFKHVLACREPGKHQTPKT